MQQTPHKMTRVSGTTEVVVVPRSCRIIAIFPEAVTLGTVAIRDNPALGSGATNLRHTCAAGLPLLGMQFGGGDSGVQFDNGLTLQLSNASDAVNIVWNNFQ